MFSPICVHEVVANQATQQPDAIAVSFDAQHLTYEELASWSDQIAAILRDRGVGPDALVGLCAERSIGMIAGMIAILKAGGACVPIDPTYPQDRVDFMIKDAGLRVLLTTVNSQDNLQLERLVHKHSLVRLDEIPVSGPRHFVSDRAVHARMHNLAYVLYTSGSTGAPKGVAMPHRSLSNLISWQIGQSAVNGLVSNAKTLQFAPVSFDVSFQEIFSTLCAGGTLVLIPDDLRRDPVGVLRLISTEKIARVFLPTVALHQLAGMAARVPLHLYLREVITAGEQLLITPAVTTFFNRLPNCRLINQYGPTETHVATAYTLTGPPEHWPNLPPIGLPISGVQAHILQDELQPVQPGDVGELCLGGECLARGYLNRSDLTEERFIPNPFGPGRLYRTGDLARLGAQQLIEFLGRTDRQIKIRGFRVEPGEVEAILAQHETVQACAVEDREDIFGYKCLVAYVVPRTDQTTTGSPSSPFRAKELPQPESLTRQLDPRWHGYLKDHLPEHMVPSTYVLLSRLPLTPSGKVDRLALPAPSTDRPPLDVPLVSPTTATEAKIASAWRTALQLKTVGVDDNFFDLGGHSLLLTHVHGILLELFGTDFPIVTLFENPTIHSLAKYFDQGRDETVTARSRTSNTARASATRQEGERRRKARGIQGDSQ